MMNFPAELKYSKSHEWVKMDGDVAVIGISDFAQDALGDLVRSRGLGDVYKRQLSTCPPRATASPPVRASAMSSPSRRSPT